MTKNNNLNFLKVAIFGIAMAYLESAVVVYLRAIYYPDGFIFPLKLIEGRIAITELWREVATMVMLITVAVIVSRRAIERFAWFIYAFAIWDIFYYIFLYYLLGWPSSLLTWDILFLIPVTWTGPVLAPVINSLTMILLASVIIHYSSLQKGFRVKILEWALLIFGSCIIIYTYIEGYTRYMLTGFSISDLVGVSPKKEMMEYAAMFVPVHFNWILFGGAELLFFIAIYLIIKQAKGKK
jgi:magnesium-transporting ATPase (P-type)